MSSALDKCLEIHHFECGDTIEIRDRIVFDFSTCNCHTLHCETSWVLPLLSPLPQPLHRPDPDYMSRQHRVNHKMRTVLIDWLVLVHIKFGLLPETLYITTNIIDRFLQVWAYIRITLALLQILPLGLVTG